MMLFRRQGLIPATRPRPRLTREQQTAQPPAAAAAESPGQHRSRTEPPRAMLEIEGLTKRYGGIVAAKDIALIVDAGEIVALIGPNGSGKTTLFNLITGLVPPSDRVLLLEGEDITGLPSHQIVERGIARTFQNLRLFSNMTVRENILVAMHSRTRPAPSAPSSGPRGSAPRSARRRSARSRSSGPSATACCRGSTILVKDSPTPTAGGSRSPARWCRGRRCCCSTSRRPA